MQVSITKLDEVFCRVDCNEMSIEMAIRDRYTFLIPDYKFHPKYKSGIWDGRIRLFNSLNKKLPLGLVTDLFNFCKENNWEVEVTNKEMFLDVVEPLDDKGVEEFIETLKGLNLPFDPYDYQKNSFKIAINHGRCIISSPTSSGKSLMIYMIAMWHFIKHNRRSLIIVPTIGLCNQMSRDFKDYSKGGIDEEMFAIINSKAKDRGNVNTTPFVVSTWQSIYKNSPEWFSQFDVILADECHEYKATAVKSMIEKCVTVRFKYGFTGTISNDMYHSSKSDSANIMTLIGLFGEVFHTTTTQKLMERGLVAELFINMITIDHKEENKKLLRSKKVNYNYDTEMKLIGTIKERRDLIIKILKNVKGNSMLLFNFKETFGEPLYEEIKEAFPNHKVFYVDGDTKDRTLAQETADKEDNVIIVASYGVFSTGISIKNIHNLFLVTPYKSLTRVLQSIGRGLRLGRNKTKCNLFDFVDDLSSRRINTTLRHGQERYKIYLNQNFKNIKNISYKIGDKDE